MSEQIDLKWLNELVENLPELPKERKNIFDISGFPNWENVNSNFLAFYIQENEEHNFERLFLNSLINCIESEVSDVKLAEQTFEAPYTVYREYSTNKRGRIDILIKSENNNKEVDAENEDSEAAWALIIENKIDHELHNNLNDYWDSVKAKNKLGIVLSKGETDLKSYELNQNTFFVNVTHKQLVLAIEANISEFFLKSDDRHLLLLKEYILNIKNLYKNYRPNFIMKDQLVQFHKHSDEIIKLLDINNNLLSYINKECTKAFENLGCKASTTTVNTRSKHYFFDSDNKFFEKNKWKDSTTKNFRFWVDMNRLRFKNTFQCYFEVYGRENQTKAAILIDKLNEIKNREINSLFYESPKGGVNQTHIFLLEFKIDNLENTSFNEIIFEGVKEKLKMEREFDVLDFIFEEWEKIEL